MFNEGALQCSEAPTHYSDICIASPEEMSSINVHKPSFVYLDCGCWADNADGKNTKRRDFGLVCGPHTYLCEFTGGKSAPKSKVPSVQNLFDDLASQGCGVKVVKYAKAKPPMSDKTPTDPTLYLFLGDTHLPPVIWFYKTYELVGVNFYADIPDWLANIHVFKRQKNYLYNNYLALAQRDQNKGNVKVASGPITGDPDIFRLAGKDLISFLDGLCHVREDVKQKLHFIQTGDMFELWVGRKYQFKSGIYEPEWLSKESPNRVADWALEILIQNAPVFEAFRRLDGAGLAEVKYLWGNHDGYLSRRSVTDQLASSSSEYKRLKRDPMYIGLNGDLYAEHGHRFDGYNFDNTSKWKGVKPQGPVLTNFAYWMPQTRKLEKLRDLISFGPSERELYLLGATLIYLFMKYDRGKNPFSIYVMGHTHAATLFTFNIQTEYHLYEVK